MTAVNKLPEKLMGSTICLAKNDESISQEMFSLIDQNRDALKEFLPWPEKILSLQDQINYIKMTNESWNQKALFDYGIFRLSDQKFIGNVGVHSIDWRNSRCEFGYWVARPFEGQGKVSEAIALLEKACFKAGFKRLEIRCSSRNEKSAFVALRSGFTLEGILKSESFENGKFRDTYIFAKLAPETALN